MGVVANWIQVHKTVTSVFSTPEDDDSGEDTDTSEDDEEGREDEKTESNDESRTVSDHEEEETEWK